MPPVQPPLFALPDDPRVLVLCPRCAEYVELHDPEAGETYGCPLCAGPIRLDAEAAAA